MPLHYGRRRAERRRTPAREGRARPAAARRRPGSRFARSRPAPAGLGERLRPPASRPTTGSPAARSAARRAVSSRSARRFHACHRRDGASRLCQADLLAGAGVEVQRLDGARWRTVARATVDERGEFPPASDVTAGQLPCAASGAGTRTGRRRQPDAAWWTDESGTCSRRPPWRCRRRRMPRGSRIGARKGADGARGAARGEDRDRHR